MNESKNEQMNAAHIISVLHMLVDHRGVGKVGLQLWICEVYSCIIIY